jgi:Gpi18-like mannosyltransferase
MDALNGSPGLTAFANPFSDYTPLYLYFLKLLSFIHIYDLFTIKSLSILFDLFLAFVAYLILSRTLNNKYIAGTFFMAFALVLMIPTVILNSSLWAQCDSIYSAFTLLSLYFILRDRPVAASISFGIAISFKLQAIFFLPVLLGYLLARSARAWVNILWIPVIFVITLIPAWLGGGDFVYLLLTYVRQAGEFTDLTLSAPSVFAFINSNAISPAFSAVLSFVGYIIGLVIALWVISMVKDVFQKYMESREEKIVLIALVSVLFIPFFLPHMHDRYFYLADVVSVIYAFYNPRRWYVPVLVIAASFFSYMTFLSSSVLLFTKLILKIAIPAGFMAFVIITQLPKVFQRPVPAEAETV